MALNLLVVKPECMKQTLEVALGKEENARVSSLKRRLDLSHSKNLKGPWDPCVRKSLCESTMSSEWLWKLVFKLVNWEQVSGLGLNWG